jgi:hypothetical protein
MTMSRGPGRLQQRILRNLAYRGDWEPADGDAFLEGTYRWDRPAMRWDELTRRLTGLSPAQWFDACHIFDSIMGLERQGLVRVLWVSSDPFENWKRRQARGRHNLPKPFRVVQLA